jgi:putative sigma-54 modulation protein
MRLTLTGRQHVEITPALGRLVEKKMARVVRVLNTGAVSAQVELRPERFRRVVDVHVHARGGHMLQGRAVATSWDEALSQAIDRLLHQGQKLKGKWQERKREARPVKRAIPEPREAARARRVVRARRYPVRPMTVADAALALPPAPDAFLVFRNTGTDSVCVVFRRKDGDIGLIEPKA